MRNVSAAFQEALSNDTLQVTELIILELADGTIYRYTTHQTDLVWDSPPNTYSAVVPVNPGELSSRHTGDFDDYELVLGHIDTPWSANLTDSIFENVKVTIKRIRWNAIYAADEEITVFVGLGNVRFDRKVLNLTCRPMINSLNIQVPRHAYQEPCNYAVFEPGCTLTQSNYAYNGTSTGGSKTSLQDTTRGTCYKVAFDGGDEDNPVERADTITGQQNGGTATVVQITYLTAGTGYLWYVALSGTQFGDNEPLQNGDADAVICNGTPAADDTFYQLGEIKITSGPNNGQRRQIHSDSGGLTIPTWGFPVGLEVGMTYSIYPGCDGLAITCRDKFDNKIPYRGFPYIRRPEETIWR